MFQRKLCILGLLIACGEKELNVPTGSQQPGTNAQDNCPDDWEERGDGDSYWVDPIECRAWSKLTSQVNWEEAQDHCANLSTGGVSWSIPSIGALEALANRSTPFEQTDSDLWSSDIDSASGLIWTANLDQPGMSILLDRSSEAGVRWVGD